jgi:hypothetical protein
MSEPKTQPPYRHYDIPLTADEYYPDPEDPLDRWLQTPNSANATTLQRLISAFAIDAPSRIIDPFCGAGSTAVAARRLGAPFFGIEIDPVLAEIAFLKATLSKDDLNYLEASLPSTVSEQIIFECRPGRQRRCTLGAGLVAMLRSPAGNMEKEDLLSYLWQGVTSAPLPNFKSDIACMDALSSTAWRHIAPSPRSILFTSPPFPHRQPRSYSKRNLREVRQHLEHLKEQSSAKPPSKHADVASMITVVLSNATDACPGLLAIIEYEDSSTNLSSLNRLLSKIKTIPGLGIREVLETQNFSGEGVLYEIIASAEPTSDN